MARNPKGTATQVWQERLQRFQSTGLSLRDFCNQEGVSLPSFYHWRKRLRQQHNPAARPAKTAFQTLQVTPLLAELLIELPGGTRLRVPAEQLALARTVVRQVVKLSPQQGGGGAG